MINREHNMYGYQNHDRSARQTANIYSFIVNGTHRMTYMEFRHCGMNIFVKKLRNYCRGRQETRKEDGVLRHIQ